MEKIIGFLRQMPVSVNCYYGDPTLQWQDTLAKLNTLAETGHTGPVGVITKGAISRRRAQELRDIDLPGLMVMVSISELPEKQFELIGHRHRYKALKNLQEAGVKCFAAVRPLTPPHNTAPEVIERIFSRLEEVGCELACVSGFRGDESIVEAMKPDDKIRWALRVKQMTGFAQILECAQNHGVRVFTRVACAVSHLMGSPGSYNPYWGSPVLVRCEAIGCPMKGTCGPVEPDMEVLDWLREVVGYDAEYQPSPRKQCPHTADDRLNCRSCCTTCFPMPQPRVLVRNAQTLGDLTFCRFMLGGTLCVKPGMVDGGQKDIGDVKLVQARTGFPIQCINTWWVMSTQLDHCFGCKYCIAGLYPNRGPVGCPPVHLLNFFPAA